MRWWRKRFGRRRAVPLDATRSDLVVVASSFDDAEACSRALERAAGSEPGWIADEDAVLRHHLRVPADQVQGAVELAGQDRYTVAAPDAPAPQGVDPVAAEPGAEELVGWCCSGCRSSTRCTVRRSAPGWRGWRSARVAVSSDGMRCSRRGIRLPVLTKLRLRLC
ncbi:hypothetical protein BTZ20_3458 [Rhodococcus sp. MTM3W5.2]|nr:hypothetical protein BTZ20_3458 [Rhodococcus sp. MTM3W5.2]